MAEALAILRAGICCPVGLDAAQATSALRAGVSRRRTTAFRDRNLDPIVVGHLADELLPPLGPGWEAGARADPLEARMLRLALGPLREVLDPRFAGAISPIYLAGPEPTANDPSALSSGFIPALVRRAKRRVDLDHSRVFARGGAGLFAALSAAREQLLGPNSTKFVVAGGVDSYMARERLGALERDGRLKIAGPRDGFIPGEAGAFLLLTTASTCRRHNLVPLAWIGASAVAEADASALPHEGLARACAPIWSATGPELEPIRLVAAGSSGELGPAREWGVAHLRARERFAEPLRVEQPAEYIGDPGAALAPLMIASVALRLRARMITGPVLTWGRSYGGSCGAAILYAGG